MALNKENHLVYLCIQAIHLHIYSSMYNVCVIVQFRISKKQKPLESEARKGLNMGGT